MTDDAPAPGRPLRAFLEAVPAPACLELLEHVNAAVADAERAARCVPEAGSPGHETVPQLLAYLSEAIRELEAARAIVVAELEGRVGS